MCGNYTLTIEDDYSFTYEIVMDNLILGDNGKIMKMYKKAIPMRINTYRMKIR